MAELSFPRILVVGAGPTGLILANTLCRFDIPFDIVEAKDTLTTTSKGLSINLSSQLALSILNIGHKVGTKGQVIKRLNLLAGKQRVASVNFNFLPGNQHLIVQPQSVTEYEMYDCLIKQGGQIEWGSKLVDILMTENVYQVAIQQLDGSESYREYDYVIGCEGKESIVRQKIGAKLNGIDYPMYFVLGDFKFIAPGRLSEVHYIEYEGQFFILIPLSSDMCRIVLVQKSKPSSKQEISEILCRVVNHYFGKNLAAGEAVWTSTSKVYLRIADKLRSDGLFICGDSCHLVSPIGGTGMNMGIQDAFNLGCKLAAVFHGYQREDILDNYEVERLEAINGTCAKADVSTKMIFDKAFRAGNITTLLPKINQRKVYRKILPEGYSGISMRYPSTISQDLDPAFGIHLGTLFVDAKEFYSLGDKQKPTPVLVLVPNSNGLLSKQQWDKVSLLMDYLSCYYQGLFRIFCANSKNVMPEGVASFNSQFCNLPELSLALVSMEGIVEYACFITSIDTMRRHIDQYYLKQKEVV